jgi:cobaltochelatase CobS
MHWPADVRRQQGIADFAFDRFGSAEPGQHAVLPYVRKLAAARLNIMLIGGAGVGKTFLAEQLANLDFDGRFGMVPMTGGATPSWLVGAYTLEGYRSRPFVDIYKNGGIFLFDEMDAADPNMLLLVNSALANGKFQNPVTGEMIERHDDFVAIACTNTMGLGADRHFKGRSGLDAATVDRFRMGRVQVNLDENLAKHLFFA